LSAFFAELLASEEGEEVLRNYRGEYLESLHELPEDFAAMSVAVFETWMATDASHGSGERFLDRFLRRAHLKPGERSFLTAMGKTTMRLYEVVSMVPGVSIELRDVLDGTLTTVHERSASRTLVRSDMLAARIIGKGCSGEPELERGLLQIPALLRRRLLAVLESFREDFRATHPHASIDAFYREAVPIMHRIWLDAIFKPAIPALRNSDGEEMVTTRVSYEILDHAQLDIALDGAESLGIQKREQSRWEWLGSAVMDGQTILGQLQVDGNGLVIETNSVERGARARSLIEGLVGPSLRLRATTHEDISQHVARSITAEILSGADPRSAPRDETNAEEVADLALDYYARHYRKWLDEPVPALGGLTPRGAADDPKMHEKLESLLRDLEGAYARALHEGAPAYDPSWMWGELGLRVESDKSHPPQLAHERVAARVPGLAEAVQTFAQRERKRPDFAAKRSTLQDETLRSDLTLARLAREHRDIESARVLFEDYVRLMANLEIHGRKIFWVDADLAYLLSQTEIELPSDALRLPFTSFAVVFTDRTALSFAERMLSKIEEDQLRGQILRVATIYVTQEMRSTGRVIAITAALDALGADLPSLVRFEISSADQLSLAQVIACAGRQSSIDSQVTDRDPARGLFRLIVNAILYASSASVVPEKRVPAPQSTMRRALGVTPPSSDSVYFLPGTIDIRQVRKIQELQRAPQGGALLARFMVRGHWRRPSASWADQRLRWIEPYWKGPDLAVTIEKAYRLRT
jgi:hypothetical protein